MLQHLRTLFFKISLASKTNTGLLADAEAGTSGSIQKFATVTPIFRIFDERKAREFYMDFLGATTVFEHRFSEHAPLYIGVKLGNVELHLSEHHGDGTPGSGIRIQCNDVHNYHRELTEKKYRYANPGKPCFQPWGEFAMTLSDPFQNRITFWQPAKR